jgi:hypothetical protein
MSGLTRVLSAIAVVAIAEAGAGASLHADPFYQGPGKCADCHKSETAVYQQTKHANSFKDIHRQPAVKDIIAAAGGDANMRRNDVCTTCHYTMTQTDARAKPAATAGTSCESCHGPSSDWIAIHNDFGGPSAKAETETPAHKAQRIQKAIQAGMIRPDMHYEIATNCLSCHEQARPGIAPATLAKMIDAGHPAGTNFELVQYSQGTIRHRFYPPDVTKNREMTPAELSQLFVVGQAAALVQAAAVSGKVNNQKYQDTLNKVQANAHAALDAIKGQVPEAAALLAEPTDANARKLVAAVAGKDLSAQVGSLLPAKNTYK